MRYSIPLTVMADFDREVQPASSGLPQSVELIEHRQKNGASSRSALRQSHGSR
jgi:hypothetical protein